MQKLWAVTLNDLRAIFAERSIWLQLFVIPIGLVFVVGMANGALANMDETRTRLDVIDQDESALSAAVIDALRADETLLICTPGTDADGCSGAITEIDSANRVDGGITEALVIIPAGFGERARSGDPARILYRADDQLGQPSVTFTRAQNAVQRVSGALVAQRAGELLVQGALDANIAGAALTTQVETDTLSQRIYERAAAYWSQNPVTLDFALSAAGGDDNAEQTADTTGGFAQSVPGMGSMYVMFNVFAGMVALLQERKQWTLQRLATLPLAKWQILGGKMLARFLLGMIQFVVVFTVGYVIGLRYDSLPALLALMVAFVAVITALTFLLATVIGTEQQAGAVSLFLALTLAPIGGAWWPLEIVPGWMQSLSLASPVGWVMRGFNDLMIYDAGASAALLPVGVLTAAAAVIFAAAVARFSYT